eukprot:3749575-Pyramimonas_sp.AAC.1
MTRRSRQTRGRAKWRGARGRHRRVKLRHPARRRSSCGARRCRDDGDDEAEARGRAREAYARPGA